MKEERTPGAGRAPSNGGRPHLSASGSDGHRGDGESHRAAADEHAVTVRPSPLTFLQFVRRHRWTLPLSLLSLLCFAHLGSEMREGELDALDAAVAHAIQALRGPLDGVMFAFTSLGNGVSLTALTALVCAGLVWSGQARKAGFLVASAAGAALLNAALKVAFHRPRPGVPLAYLLTEPSSFSFPSGHAMGSMGVFASLAVLVCASGASRALRLVAVAVASALVTGVGVSRIYLGVHFPSDVLGGQLAGAAWVSGMTGWFYPWLLPGEATKSGAPPGA